MYVAFGKKDSKNSMRESFRNLDQKYKSMVSQMNKLYLSENCVMRKLKCHVQIPKAEYSIVTT